MKGDTDIVTDIGGITVMELGEKAITFVDYIASMFPQRLRVTIVSFFALIPIIWIVLSAIVWTKGSLGYGAFPEDTQESSPYYSIREDSVGKGLWSENLKKFLIAPDKYYMTIQYKEGMTLVEIFKTETHFRTMQRAYKLYDKEGHQLLKHDIVSKEPMELYNSKFIRFKSILNESVGYFYTDGSQVNVIDYMILNFSINYGVFILIWIVLACIIGTLFAPEGYKLL